jgi:hypothetical protein
LTLEQNKNYVNPPIPSGFFHFRDPPPLFARMQPVAASCEARLSNSPRALFVQDLGRPMTRKQRFRFGFRGVFAGRPGRFARSALAYRQFGFAAVAVSALYSVLFLR